MSDSGRMSHEERELDKGVRFWYAEAAKYRNALEEIRDIYRKSSTSSAQELIQIAREALKPDRTNAHKTTA